MGFLRDVVRDARPGPGTEPAGRPADPMAGPWDSRSATAQAPRPAVGTVPRATDAAPAASAGAPEPGSPAATPEVAELASGPVPPGAEPLDAEPAPPPPPLPAAPETRGREAAPRMDDIPTGSEEPDRSPRAGPSEPSGRRTSEPPAAPHTSDPSEQSPEPPTIRARPVPDRTGPQPRSTESYARALIRPDGEGPVVADRRARDHERGSRDAAEVATGVPEAAETSPPEAVPGPVPPREAPRDDPGPGPSVVEAAPLRPASPPPPKAADGPPAEPSTPGRSRTNRSRREAPLAVIPRDAEEGSTLPRPGRPAAGTRPDDRTPPAPRVHIGTVDVVVMAPEPSRAPPAAPPTRTGLASRLYLRRL